MCECRGVGADKSAMGAINRPLRPVHVMQISGGCEDKSRTWLYQVYQVFRAACEPAVFSSNRMSRVSGVSGVSGVSDKFEWKWLTVSGVSGVSGVSDKFEWKWLTVSGVSGKFEWKWLTVSEFREFQVFQEFQVGSVFGADSEQNARYFFGVVELMLMFVGGVDAVVGSHLAPG